MNAVEESEKKGGRACECECECECGMVRREGRRKKEGGRGEEEKREEGRGEEERRKRNKKGLLARIRGDVWEREKGSNCVGG